MDYELSPTVEVPTHRGIFRAMAFRREASSREHLVLARGELSESPDPVPLRVHSECLTGDVFGSERCDCHSQLDWSLDYITAKNRGLLIYLRQEGRGIGLVGKLHAYALQASGMDTFEANVELGHLPDERSYEDAVFVLRHMGISRVALISNNPLKAAALTTAGIEVTTQVAPESKLTSYNERYLLAKRERYQAGSSLG